MLFRGICVTKKKNQMPLAGIQQQILFSVIDFLQEIRAEKVVKILKKDYEVVGRRKKESLSFR